MLKKTLKKLIALTLATVTVATGSTAVSASILTPKKSHSEAQITEYVDYFNEITDDYTFRPDGYVPALIDCMPTTGTHDSFNYEAWQMTQLLQNTPGIDDEQKADMVKASKKWKKAYVSELMIGVYWKHWNRVFDYVEENEGTFSSKDTMSKYEARVKKAYTTVDTFLSRKAKYNQKLASQLKKFNKTRYTVWNADIRKYFSWSKAKRISYANKHFEPYMGSTLLKKYRMNQSPDFTPHTKIYVDDFGDKENYRTDTLGIWGYSNANSPCAKLVKHTRYTKW